MTNAAAVSRAIRSAGFRPLPSGTPRHREGVRVEKSVLGSVNVTVDTGSSSRNDRLRYQIADALVLAGYEVDSRTVKLDQIYSIASLSVTRSTQST